MSTSPADPTTMDNAAEPLRSLLRAIAEARELPAPTPHEPAAGDPLVRLRQTMVGGARPDEASGGPDEATPPAPATAPVGDAAALVGREVLAVLREQPLDGSARAAAVERLAAQIAQPDPNALRAILAILVTGRRD